MGDGNWVLVGGGGVRGPQFVREAARRADELGVPEIVLLDVDPSKLALLGSVSRHLAAQRSTVRVTSTTQPRAALDGAAVVVTAIRPGGDSGRVLDEQIALARGVLGQETTGAAGFAMAMRTIPAIRGYATLMAEVCPDAWLLNLTNPAGMVVQAVRDEGHTKVVGICDSANLAQHAVAAYLQRDPGSLRPEVFGLNHLSWTRAVRDGHGQDLLAPLLLDDEFRARTLQRIFPPELVAIVRAWINEYLFYWYFAEQAIERILAEPLTRGEQMLQRNRELLDELRAAGSDRDRALEVYRGYEQDRRSTYMHYADPDPHHDDGVGRPRDLGDGPDGYAAVALDVMAALAGGEPCYTAVNVCNQGAIDGLADDDVVEVSTLVDADGIHPLPIGAIPAPQRALVRSVKTYERLAVAAISARSRHQAVQALMAHPLVQSYPRAAGLVEDYLRAHAAYVGVWS